MKDNKYTSSFSKFKWVDMFQKNGTWVPAFPKPSLEKEEEYIQKIIKKDVKNYLP